MTNIEKYRNAFAVAFEISSLDVDGLEYQSIDEWDSVGHMALIAELENTFGIELQADDVIEFGSFSKGKIILAKYNVSL